MKSVVTVLAVIALLSAGVRAADVSGVWIVSLSTSGGQDAPTFAVTLAQDGERLSGSCLTADLDEEFAVAGQVNGDAVVWRCVHAQQGEVAFIGRLAGTGQLRGSWTTSASAKGEFMAVKR